MPGTSPSYITAGTGLLNGHNNAVSFTSGQFLGPVNGFPTGSGYTVFFVSEVTNPNPGGNFGNLISGTSGAGSGHALYFNPTNYPPSSGTIACTNTNSVTVHKMALTSSAPRLNRQRLRFLEFPRLTTRRRRLAVHRRHSGRRPDLDSGKH